MCQAVQEMCDDARAEGHSFGLAEGQTKGRSQALHEAAQRMLTDPRFSPEDICKFLGLPLEEVLKLRQK